MLRSDLQARVAGPSMARTSGWRSLMPRDVMTQRSRQWKFLRCSGSLDWHLHLMSGSSKRPFMAWRARLVIGASIGAKLCQPCRGKDFDMAKKLLHGRLHKTADENVWQLLETEVTSGACHWTGLMAVYVDDLLVSAEDKAAAAALEAISKVWRGLRRIASRWSIVWVRDRNRSRGDGFLISERMYEEEMVYRSGVSKQSWMCHTFVQAKMMKCRPRLLTPRASRRLRPRLEPYCGWQRGRDQTWRWA